MTSKLMKRTVAVFLMLFALSVGIIVLVGLVDTANGKSSSALSTTIQKEFDYQKGLVENVTGLAADSSSANSADSPSQTINTTKTVQTPPAVVKIPSTRPVRVPITRAS